MVAKSKDELKSTDLELIEKLQSARDELLAQMEQVIVGQKRVIEEILITLLARGHCLLVGVPGLAKTLIISTVAEILDLKFNRIQFTPDLMPSDITGTDIIEEDAKTRKRSFKFLRGPIFANIILADEINRTPPKTQAALLQAMQEYKVTTGGVMYKLEEPFFVLATQNPIEQEGTYPLPEAQLDRFMFNTFITYPSFEEEQEIVRKTTSAHKFKVKKVMDGKSILKLQEIVRKIPVADHIVSYAVSLARSTRPEYDESPDFVKKWVRWGAGPRASQYLILAGKTRCALRGRYTVAFEDIQSVAESVMRHRIITNFKAEAEGVDSRTIIKKLLDTVKKPSE